MSKEIAKKIKRVEERIHQDESFQKENPYALFSFIDLLYYFMNNRFPDKKDSYIYHKAHINAKLFSKIRNPSYHPSRKTIIALGLALELDLNEVNVLLNSANYSLSFNNTFDIAIIYCIEHRIYDLYLVNDILCELDEY